MEPLITIETVPISIEYVEKNSTYSSVAQMAKLRLSQQENRMTIQSQPITIQMRDTYESAPTTDWNNLTYTASSKFSEDGELKIDINVDDFHFQQFGRGIENVMESIPKFESDSMGYSGSMNIRFDLSQLPNGMPMTNDIDTSFLPPDLELKIVEQAKVIIKYVGGPLYIPKSSDPDYDPPETEEKNPGVELNFDAKA